MAVSDEDDDVTFYCFFSFVNIELLLLYVCCYPRQLTVSVGRIIESFCLFVCLEYNSKRNDPKVFKLGIRNDLRIS